MVLAVVYLLALASAVESAATGPAAVVDWTRGATGGGSTPVATIVSLEEAEYTTAILNVTYWDPDTNTTKSESKEIGKYGEGRVGPVSGVLVHVGPEDDRGCVLPLTQDPLPTEPWIALIRRGECNFDVKVDNAYKSHAAGVIIFDIKNSSNLEKMKLSPQRNISAVLTTKWKGEELARLVDNGTRVYVQITIGSHCLRPYGNINRTSVLFVSISFIVLMIISLAWLVFYYIQRFRYIHAKDRLAKRLCNAAKKALSKIPTKHIKSEDKEMQGDGECCAVCIEPYKISDVIRILPCKHEFHKSCIDPWLLEHRTCPMCKMDILKYYGFTEEEHQRALQNMRRAAVPVYQFTGSQESILHIDMDDAVLASSESHDQPSPALVVVGTAGMISDMSRGQSNVVDSSHSGSEEQVPPSDAVNCRAPSPDEFTPTLGLGPCTLMVVSELDPVPSNSLTSPEKSSKSSNKDDLLQKEEDSSSCERISLDSEKFPITTLVKDPENELEAAPVDCSESCELPDCERGDGSERRQQ